MKLSTALVSVLMSLALAGFAVADTPESGSSGEFAREWNFRVLLDGNEIGYHNFSLLEEDGAQQLTAEADFKVKFLFITAYRYQHENHETWRNNCLQAIESRTDANGRRFEVKGSRSEDRLSIKANDARIEVPGCVKTFAYWNPDILVEPRLLNSQTGEVLPVDVEMIARETLNVRGEDTPAQRYRLEAKNMKLDLWYSDDQQWLALESTVKGGRKLRYELT